MAIVEAMERAKPEIQHIGSTAIPGMPGKPVLDILVAVKPLQDLPDYMPIMISMGYENEPINNPGHWFFWRGNPRSHQVHIVEHDSWHYWRLLLFRDFLRMHPDEAREYEILKRGLAIRYQNQRKMYSEAKTDYVRAVTAKALAERPELQSRFRDRFPT
jgi:GrpB-like predicted nucleotidyltransferase (UPF0157 family)